MKILVTGGTGYIGSHTIVELLTAGHDVVVVDNLCNSSRLALQRIEQITGKTTEFHKVDVRNTDALQAVFEENQFDSVIHFAGLKAVGESESEPLKYYDNNVGGLLSLLKLVQRYKVPSFIFSSSATVYGEHTKVPYRETQPTGQDISNVYGRTKYTCEQILIDQAKATGLKVSILRYFNPIGAHSSGLIGEDPKGLPNNLLPYVSRVATGELPELLIYGDNYPTRDGTGVRDYVHVVDLAKGHCAALNKAPDKSGVGIYNLGTGQGTSVLEIVKTFEKAAKVNINRKIVDRRIGDLAEYYADVTKAEKELKWKAEKSIEEMCQDTWKFVSKNPKGYES